MLGCASDDVVLLERLLLLKLVAFEKDVEGLRLVLVRELVYDD